MITKLVERQEMHVVPKSKYEISKLTLKSQKQGKVVQLNLCQEIFQLHMVSTKKEHVQR